MSSKVEICNRGLIKLGAERIVSLTENSVNARACNAVYESLKEAELRKHTWSCATKRASLAADSTSPIFTKTNAFQLPSDFIRLLPLDEEDNIHNLDRQIEGRKIVTDDSAPLQIRYIYNVTDTNEMDPLFRETLSSLIALELCELITQSNTKKLSLKDDYRDIIKEAKRVNAIERPALTPPPDPWITVRG